MIEATITLTEEELIDCVMQLETHLPMADSAKDRIKRLAYKLRAGLYAAQATAASSREIVGGASVAPSRDYLGSQPDLHIEIQNKAAEMAASDELHQYKTHPSCGCAPALYPNDPRCIVHGNRHSK